MNDTRSQTIEQAVRRPRKVKLTKGEPVSAGVSNAESPLCTGS
jgi:hypothetical protein